MADDAMASYLSKAGGLGLAKSVESLLTQAKANKS
jgi:Rod binding domain-containing protein